MRGTVLVLLMSAGLGVGASAVRAAEPATARVERLARDAAVAFREADYQRAVELLERAYEIRQVANILYNLGRSYEKLGRTERAVECFRRYVESSDAEPALKSKAEARLAAYDDAHRTKPVTPDSQPEPVEKPHPTRGNDLAPTNLEPVAPTPTVTPRDTITDGRRRDRIIGLSLMGVGVVLAVSATGLAAHALSLHGDFSNTQNEDDKRALMSTARTQSAIADGLFAGAVVSAGVGAYFVWRGYHKLAPSAPAAMVAPCLVVGGGGLVAVGRF